MRGLQGDRVPFAEQSHSIETGVAKAFVAGILCKFGCEHKTNEANDLKRDWRADGGRRKTFVEIEITYAN